MYIFPFCHFVEEQQGFLAKIVLDSLLATLENITNVDFIMYCILIVIHTSLISNVPGGAQSVADIVKHYYCVLSSNSCWI